MIVSFEFNLNGSTNNSRIVITLNKILPINIYKKIQYGITNYCHNSFEIELIGEIHSFTTNDIKDYFKYFIKKLSLSDSLVENLLNIIDIKIENDKVTISYFDDFEEKLLHDLKSSILKEFVNAGFKINCLELIFSKDKQNLELYKTQNINEINKSLKSIKLINENEAQVLRDNKVNIKNIMDIDEINENTKYGVL